MSFLRSQWGVTRLVLTLCFMIQPSASFVSTIIGEKLALARLTPPCLYEAAGIRQRGAYTNTNGIQYRLELVSSRNKSSRIMALHLLPDISFFTVDTETSLSSESVNFVSTLPQNIASAVLNMDKDTSETLSGPLFGASLFPYLAFLYFLARPENETPKGVIVGFAACLLFVVMTIPAAIAANLLYGASLADCDWLHGSAESMLTITNLVTVIPFRQAISAKQLRPEVSVDRRLAGSQRDMSSMPRSATEYGPMVTLLAILTVVAIITAIVPALNNPDVHTPYLNGFMDLPSDIFLPLSAQVEPENALSVATWIIHVSSLVEFLVVMGFCWRWADIVNNPRWKGLTWGLLPLHSSGITACVSHLFYNNIAVLVLLQALLTCIGNSTAAYAAYRISLSNGWNSSATTLTSEEMLVTTVQQPEIEKSISIKKETMSLVGIEDLGEALDKDNDFNFLFKLFTGCAVASYMLKYGELFFNFPNDSSNSLLALGFISIPSLLNAYKWYRRSQDPTFEGLL